MVTTTTELIETGEQRDSRGRKRTPARRRDELVRAWRSSGLTQAQFARREGLKYPTFAHWVQEARRRGLAERRVPRPILRAHAAAHGAGLHRTERKRRRKQTA